jgi:hypothetical protein
MKINPLELELPKLRPVPDLTEEEAKVLWNLHIRTEHQILVQGNKVIDGQLHVKAAQTLKLPEIEVNTIDEVLHNEPHSKRTEPSIYGKVLQNIKKS